MITRIIRDEGSQKVIICDANVPYEEALKKVREYIIPTDMVSRVSCKKRWYSRTPNHKYDVVAIDCGIKHNIIRKLNEKGCNVTVVPYNITSEEILKMSPDGLFLSNGPGNPEDVQTVINVVRELRGKLPIFGICLGHQMISLALGAKTFKMKFGHRGGNHPVKNLETGRTYISSQNHGYAVVNEEIEKVGAKVSYINANDGTCEGVDYPDKKAFSVQFHPEACSGPHDTRFIFDKFIEMMGGSK